MKSKKRHGKELFLIALVIVIIDQASKLFARNNLEYVKNTGASFGILKGQTSLIILITIFVIFLIIYYSRKEYIIAFPFILGGALGNLIDRVLYGHVIDFINLRFIPTFNVADIANTIGGILLVVEILKGGSVKGKK